MVYIHSVHENRGAVRLFLTLARKFEAVQRKTVTSRRTRPKVRRARPLNFVSEIEGRLKPALSAVPDEDEKRGCVRGDESEKPVSVVTDGSNPLISNSSPCCCCIQTKTAYRQLLQHVFH